MRFILLTVVFFVIFSCSSKKDILLLQDVNKTSSFELSYDLYLIKPDDILKIDIKSGSSLINLNNNEISTQNQTRESLIYDGFVVDPDGYVNYPSLGMIKVSDLSLDDVEAKIASKIKNEGILKNPNVDVKLLNSFFTILGEVNKPGRYNFVENNMDILQAIGMSGDMTINGVRDDVKIIRNKKGKFVVSTVDLTNSLFLNDNSKFQVFSGDIIIVNPNSSRVKNAGVISNTGNLLSILSLILSSIIVIRSVN